jgi:hypothetical protein
MGESASKMHSLLRQICYHGEKKEVSMKVKNLFVLLFFISLKTYAFDEVMLSCVIKGQHMNTETNSSVSIPSTKVTISIRTVPEKNISLAKITGSTSDFFNYSMTILGYKTYSNENIWEGKNISNEKYFNFTQVVTAQSDGSKHSDSLVINRITGNLELITTRSRSVLRSDGSCTKLESKAKF